MNVATPRQTAPDPGVQINGFAAAAWLAAPFVCLLIYRDGLTAWFQADDFAWLGLKLQVHDARSLLHALFAPMAQGTIRPWSERAFFLALQSMFGVNALPFRICVFLTQCANLTLLTAITRRATGSLLAGCCAALLWLVNVSLAWPMTWSSVYNQVLEGFFLMTAFWFLLRHIETGRRRYYFWQWAVFLLGFGALEVNVVYPALGALYTFLCARKFFSATLPLFVPSAIFAVADRMVAPAQQGGPYSLDFDATMLVTFARYASRSLVPLQIEKIKGGPDVVLGCLLAAALVGFALTRIRRKDWLPVFCFGWFAIVLAPVLPLRDHFSIYYLVLPSIGLAMLGGYALDCARKSGIAWRIAAAVLVSAYAVTMLRADRIEVAFWHRRSVEIQRMVLGVARAHQLHPAQTILLDGVDEEMFRDGVRHHPFGIFGVTAVYLTPGSALRLASLGLPVEDYELPGGPVVQGLDHDQIVVYQVGGPRLKAVTSTYTTGIAPKLDDAPPVRIDLANPLMGYLLGPEWYAPEEGFRWMPRRATLRIGGPHKRSDRLYLNGFCPPAELQAAPLPVRVWLDGVPLGEILLKSGDTPFHASLPVSDQSVGRKQVEIAIEAGRTSRTANDGRNLGLAMWSAEIR